MDQRESGHRFLLLTVQLAIHDSSGGPRPGMSVASAIAMRCGGLMNKLPNTALTLRGEQWLCGVWCNHYSVHLLNATTKLDCMRAVPRNTVLRLSSGNASSDQGVPLGHPPQACPRRRSDCCYGIPNAARQPAVPHDTSFATRTPDDAG